MKQMIADWLKQAGPMLHKFKYPALILLLGLALVLLPGKTEKKVEKPAETTETEPSNAVAQSEDSYRLATERELAAILSQVDSAGRVEVMLTLRSGAAVQYQTDYDASSQTGGDTVSSASRQTTVILSRDGAYNEAAVVKTEYPAFQGALIVSEGADNPGVRLALESAVSALLGLGTDKITVVKMK